jgi:exoribonuclease II
VSELPVVWFERRSSLCLGAVKRESPKKLTLIDEEGDTTRIQRGRVLVTLDSRVGAKKVAADLASLLTSWKEKGPQPLSEDELWESLPDDPIPLSEVAQARYEASGDGEVYALVRGLTRDAVPRGLRPSFFVREGTICRRPAEQREQIRRRQELAEQEVRLRSAVAEWWEGGGQAPAELADVLAALGAYALAGDKAEDHQRSARIAKRLGIETPDDLLLALEARGTLPRHVNEQPARLGLPQTWNAAARAEASAASELPLDPRGLDLREVPTVAIDAPGADEIDDALSFFVHEGRPHLAIHIACPQVAPDSALDRAAAARGTSTYFPGQTLPMFPGEITQRFGLEAGQEREALSYLAPLAATGAPEAGRFTRTRIRVDRHLEFTSADQDPLGQELLDGLRPTIEALHARRVARNAFLHRTPNLKVEFDAEGRPQPKLLSVEGPAQDLVSELMIFYNERLALALAEAECAAFFRVQLKELQPPVVLDDVFEILQARRSLPPARVQVDPGPQRTMGVEAYVQSSSPLRRYGDLIAQRQMLAILAGDPPAYSEDDVRELLAVLPKRERRARQAEDERQRYHLSRWLRGKGRFQGRLSRRGSRSAVFLDAWQRELPAHVKRDDQRPVGTWVEVEVQNAEPRRRLQLRVLAG